jgi:hypothetical protein
MITTPKFVAASFGLLLSVGAIVSVRPSLIRAAIANAMPATNRAQAISFPQALETKVLEDLRLRLGLPERTGSNVKIVRVVKLADPNSQPATAPLSKWQITVQAAGQSWVYIASQAGTINFAPVESIPPTVKASLAKRLGLAVPDLRIKAAQLTTRMRECPPNANCVTGYILGWRILTFNSPKLFNVDAQGNRWGDEWQERTSSAGLPLRLKSAVVRDVIDRRVGIPANLLVLAIKPITWSFCGGSGDRPTPPLMGTCHTMKYSGWQMRVQSGGVRYVYYVQRSDNENSIAPDGLQSIPQAGLKLVKQEAARRANVPDTEIHIQSVSPQYFDRCWDLPSADQTNPDCRDEIQAGWAVMALGGKSPNPGMSASWIYHVSLFGDQAKFVQAGSWSPPPMSPPPRR